MSLENAFHIKDLGTLKYFLSIKVARTPIDLLMCQQKYSSYLLDDIGLLGAKDAPTPMIKNAKLDLDDGSPLQTSQNT